MTSIFFWIAALSFMGVVFVINLVRSKRYAALEKQALIENYGNRKDGISWMAILRDINPRYH